MPVRLVPVSPGKTIKLDKPVLLIGRDPDCDVILKQSRKVSRTHCLIACVENTILVRDLGSTNGVWLNSQRVERESRLKVGDELSIADVQYNLVRVEKNNGLKETPNAEVPQVNSRKRRSDGQAARRRKPEPLDAGQAVPIAIPDEEDSFLVEASAPRLPRVSPEAMQVAADESAGEQRGYDDSGPLSQLNDDSGFDLPEPLDMGDDYEAGVDGTDEPDDSSYDAPIIPLDD
ncbi:MAG: pSer/pThr/pTyr-binding forkhead associated (FHA) protein [Planctomycetaceae bacterium]|jgi:pSer/pThr/pTyr-binding forkhead associated (FHA) protein